MSNPKQERDDQKDFKELVDLVALYSDAANRIAELETEANSDLLEILDTRKQEYANLQAALTNAETAIQVLVLRHPDWIPAGKRSIKTPYGTVNLRKSTKLVVPNEEVSIVLIRQAMVFQAQERARMGANFTPGFEASSLIRTRDELDLEALEKLEDAQLAQFRIKRTSAENFSVTPAKVEMGKAIKETVAKEAA